MHVLYKNFAEAFWMAQTTGNPEWAAKLGEAETRLNLLSSSKDTFEKTKQFLTMENVSEIEKRQLQQLLRHIETTISPEFFTKETGEMLINEFFKPAALYAWNEKIRRVTGEKLNPAHFVEVYCAPQKSVK